MLADGRRGVPRRQRAIRALRTIIGLMVAQTLVDGALGVLVAVAALELLEIGESGIGFLDSAFGVGAVLGSVAAAGMVGGRLAPSFSIGMALWGAPLALLALFPYPAAALVLFGFIGVGNMLIDVSGLTMLQRAAPEDVLARVLGVLETAILTSVAVGALLTPVLLDAVGNDATFVVVGLFLPVLAALTWRALARRSTPAPVRPPTPSPSCGRSRSSRRSVRACSRIWRAGSSRSTVAAGRAGLLPGRSGRTLLRDRRRRGAGARRRQPGQSRGPRRALRRDRAAARTCRGRPPCVALHGTRLLASRRANSSRR